MEDLVCALDCAKRLALRLSCFTRYKQVIWYRMVSSVTNICSEGNGTTERGMSTAKDGERNLSRDDNI